MQGKAILDLLLSECQSLVNASGAASGKQLAATETSSAMESGQCKPCQHMVYNIHRFLQRVYKIVTPMIEESPHPVPVTEVHAPITGGEIHRTSNSQIFLGSSWGRLRSVMLILQQEPG